MNEIRTRPWPGIAIHLWLSLTIIVLRLMPLRSYPLGWPAPDLLLVLTLFYAVRRPRLAPAPLVAGIWLMADLLFLRPPGLMAALVVLASGNLRARSRDLRRAPFLAEWVTVGLAVLAVTITGRVVLTVLFVSRPPLGPVLMEALLTVSIYPLLAALGSFLLGLHRAAPGEFDNRGQRI